MKLLENSRNPGAYTFHPGSICNLACTTCGPDASTRWQLEKNMIASSENPTILSKDVLEELPRVRSVVICGGEPVLNRSTHSLMKALDPSITVRLHFNGTVMPKQDLLETTSKFRDIIFAISVDDTEERFEYLRWPAKWSKVVDNVKWLKNHSPDNVKFAVVTTVSTLNQQSHRSVEQWVKNTIATNNQGQITTMDYNYTNVFDKASYFDNLDSKRGTNWRKCFPDAVDRLK